MNHAMVTPPQPEPQAPAEPLSPVARRIRDAIASTESYRRFSDADLHAMYATATSFMASGRFDKAVSILIVCCMYRPHQPKYLVALGVCHRRLQQYEMAVRVFSLATSMDPMHYDAALQTAECLLRLQRPDEARQVLKNLVECGKLVKEASFFGARAKVLLEFMVPA